MADDNPCECECEKFELEQFPGVYGGKDGTFPPFSVDGDVFGASATVDASSSVALRVTGMLPTPVDAVALWVPTYDIKQAIEASNSVSIQGDGIQGDGKKFIRFGGRIPLRFDSCAVGSDLLLTASVESSAKASPQLDADYGSYAATPMDFYQDAYPYAWPGISSSSNVKNIYAQSPPDGVWGNDASVFEIYRDGTLVAEFESPKSASLSFSEAIQRFPENPAPQVQASGQGTFINPMSISGGGAPGVYRVPLPSGNVDFVWTASLTPDVTGTIVVVFQDGFIQRVAAVAGQKLSIQNWMYVESTPFRTGWTYSRGNIVRMYLVPFLDVHPFPAEAMTECSQEGSYLVVAKQAGEAAGEMLASRLLAPGRRPAPLVSYGSFVILNTKWAFATGLPSDRFSDEQGESVDSAIHRENPFKERTGGLNAAEDVARNLPLFSGTLPQPVTHDFIGTRGARAAFVKPTPFGGEESLVYDTPLTKIVIRFNRPVVGLTTSMFAVTGYVPPDGDPSTLSVQSVSPADDDGYDYEVTIDGEGQVPNSMWIITFTPTGNVALNFPKFLRQQFDSKGAFPAFGKPNVLYINKASGETCAWEGVPNVYRTINPSTTEIGSTVLAARFMWCLAKDKSIGRYWIDTFPDGNPFDAAQDRVVIPRASESVTVTPGSRPEGDMSLTLLTNVTEVIDPSSSKRSTLSDQGITDFLPRLPANSTTPTNQRFSYFGVPTTIYPAAPAWIGECASPSEPQRNASLIFAGEDIDQFSVTLPAGYDFGIDTTPGNISTLVFEDLWYTIADETSENKDMPELSFYLFPDTRGMSATSGFELQGDSFSQNFWIDLDRQVNKTIMTYKASFDEKEGPNFGFSNIFNATTEGRVETTIEKVSVVMSANRGRLTYREMQTTSVTELVLTMQVWCTGKFRWREAVWDFYFPASWSRRGFSNWLGEKAFTSPITTAEIIVPPKQESTFGQLEDTQGRIWTIAKG